MSTLSIPGRRATSMHDVDTRFDALVRSPVPAPRAALTGAEFETVFDLDYAQPGYAQPGVDQPGVDQPSRAAAQQSGRRVRVLKTKPDRVAPRAVRITRRGRIVVVLAFVAVALAVMAAFGGWATASLSGGTPEPVRVIEVAPGETLYGIAAELAQPGEIRAMVHRIKELNSLSGGQISEGQKLAVPRG